MKCGIIAHGTKPTTDAARGAIGGLGCLASLPRQKWSIFMVNCVTTQGYSAADAIGQVLPPDRYERIVSLVPSETETVVRLVGHERLAGRTKFCVEPPSVRDVPVVGGTKDAAFKKIVALRPDLVLANKEENTEKLVHKLLAARIVVHVSFVRSVAESVAYVRQLTALLQAPDELFQRVRLAHQAAARNDARAVPVFVPIWNEPLMTFNAATFASDMLQLCGATNVFADRERHYPLRADYGLIPPTRTDRDTRYPRVTLDEVVARQPKHILLPDEPYAFSPLDARRFEDAVPGAQVHFVSGADLFWYGARLPEAIRRLRCFIGTEMR